MIEQAQRCLDNGDPNELDSPVLSNTVRRHHNNLLFNVTLFYLLFYHFYDQKSQNLQSELK